MKRNNWLEFAEQDLKAAHILLKEGLFNLVCFHSQQAGEKLLKAYLSVKKKRIPKEHSLVSLLALCIKEDKNFTELKSGCKALDQFYIPTRYPDAIVGSLPEGLPTLKHAQEAMKIADKILHFVKSKL